MSVLCAAVFVLCFTAGCAKVFHGTDALMEKAREENEISNAEETQIQYAGLCGKDDFVLMWFISGNEYQAHYYLPMECEAVGQNAYVFQRTYKPMERVADIAQVQWKGGYCFVVNNPACRKMRLTDDNGKATEVSIEKGAYPFVYYYERVPREYAFLDEAGNELQ